MDNVPLQVGKNAHGMTSTQCRSICILTTGLARGGGAEVQVVHLAKYLYGRGWHVEVVSMLPRGPLAEVLEVAGIRVHSLEMRRRVPDPRGLLQLRRILCRFRPGVLMTFMYHANVLGRLAKDSCGVALVVSSIRNERFGGSFRDSVMRVTDRLADIVTINSQLAGRKILERGVTSPAKLQVIPNGIITEAFKWNLGDRRRVRRELGVAEDVFLWLAVGRLEQQKDYPNLLAAFARVTRQTSKAVLCIAGQGPLLDTLQARSRALGLSERVSFLGMLTDVAEVLAASDALVLASAWEGLPNSVMEAMAAARPVVATRVGGVPEIVIDGETGFLVPPEDPAALSSAMSRLMGLSEAERADMGHAGRRYIKEHNDIRSVGAQWEALLIEGLAAKGIHLSPA